MWILATTNHGPEKEPLWVEPAPFCGPVKVPAPDAPSRHMRKARYEGRHPDYAKGQGRNCVNPMASSHRGPIPREQMLKQASMPGPQYMPVPPLGKKSILQAQPGPRFAPGGTDEDHLSKHKKSGLPIESKYQPQPVGRHQNHHDMDWVDRFRYKTLSFGHCGGRELKNPVAMGGGSNQLYHAESSFPVYRSAKHKDESSFPVYRTSTKQHHIPAARALGNKNIRPSATRAKLCHPSAMPYQNSSTKLPAAALAAALHTAGTAPQYPGLFLNLGSLSAREATSCLSAPGTPRHSTPRLHSARELAKNVLHSSDVLELERGWDQSVLVPKTMRTVWALETHGLEAHTAHGVFGK